MLYSLRLQGQYRGDSFNSTWNGQVPFLQQGSSGVSARAFFIHDGSGSLSVPVIYFPPGVSPRQGGGFYASTGGLLGRLVLAEDGSEDGAALYVEMPDDAIGHEMIQAVPPESGGLLAPMLYLEQEGVSSNVLQDLLTRGVLPETPPIVARGFAVAGAGSQTAVHFEVAQVGIYADVDPPNQDFWEDYRELALDGLGTVSGGQLFPCDSHLDCRLDEYCRDCERCLATGPPEFCHHCLDGGRSHFCSSQKFCDCASASSCDAAGDYCPGVRQIGSVLLSGTALDGWNEDARKALVSHVAEVLVVQPAEVSVSLEAHVAAGRLRRLQSSAGVLAVISAEAGGVPSIGSMLAATADTLQAALAGTGVNVDGIACAGCVSCALGNVPQAATHVCQECSGASGCTQGLLTVCTPTCNEGFVPSVPTLTCAGSGVFEPDTFVCEA